MKNGWILPLRLVFGVFLLVNGLNHFTGLFYAEPVGTTPLALQLMTALRHSHLFDVVMGFELVGGALILAGVVEPLALAMMMPISVCALYWAMVLEHDPLWSALAVLVLAANALLMITHLRAYRGVLERRALSLGETAGPGGHYDGLYMDWAAKTPPAAFAAGLIVLLAAFAFYWFLVPSITGTFALITMAVPGVLLLVGGVRGMAKSG